MSTLNRLGTVRETDVLIIGGGIAGWRQQSPLRRGPRRPACWSWTRTSADGQGRRTRRRRVYVPGPGRPSRPVPGLPHPQHWMFLEDQLLLGKFAAESRATIEKLDSWCHTFCRNADGSLATDTFKPGLPWRLAAAELDTQMKVQRHAKRIGVEFLEKTAVVDLLKEGSAPSEPSGSVCSTALAGFFARKP